MCTRSETLYFGYGSNLDVADFAAWASHRGFTNARLRLVARAFLPDHRLLFHYHSASRGGGALDVVPARHAVVPGAIFALEGDALEALDRKEGAGQRYERVGVRVLTEDGREHGAITYRVLPSHVQDELVAPTAEYVEIVRRGLAKLNQRSDALELAVEACANPSSSRCAGGLIWPRDVFVYGTLMRGECREEVMRKHGPADVAGGSLVGRLYDLGAYPGLVLGGDGLVHGEIWSYARTPALLDELDAIEGFNDFGGTDSLYRRALVSVNGDAKGERLAWTYVYRGEVLGAPQIATGRYSSRKT